MVRPSMLIRALAQAPTAIHTNQNTPFNYLNQFQDQVGQVLSLQNKSTKELWRGLLVHHMCGFQTVAKNAEKLYALGKRTIGLRATNVLCRATFYNHLVTGINTEDLRRESARMLEHKAYLMLLPPMEDIEGTISASTPESIVQNTDRFIEMLEFTAELNKTQPGQKAVMHFKPTGIFPNQLMEKYSKLHESKGTTLRQASNQLAEYAQVKNATFSHDIEELTKFCMAEWMRLAQKAIEHQVPVIVDGELRSTYFMLHALSLAMMKHLNRYDAKQPLVFDTFQCYMKDTPAYIDECQRVADEEKFTLGAKCVRGAYIDKERAIAKLKGIPDPTHPSFEATSTAYNSVIKTCLKQLSDNPKSIALYVATHNRESIESALRTLDQLQLPITTQNLHFGQIYGFCDYLTHALTSMGASVYKSTPWGGVEEWVPYFGRKAAENHTALLTARNELPYYWAEIRRRLGLGHVVKN